MATMKQAAKLRDDIVAVLRKEGQRYQQNVRVIIQSFARRLAEMSEQQRRWIAEGVSEVIGLKANLFDLVEKAHLVGRGKMAPSVAQCEYIKAATFERLPPSDQKELNTGTVIVKDRNRTRPVSVQNLTEAQWKKLCNGNKPEAGLRTPQEQGAPKETPKPTHYRILGWVEEQPSLITITWVHQRSSFKGVVTRAELKHIVEKTKPPWRCRRGE